MVHYQGILNEQAVTVWMKSIIRHVSASFQIVHLS